MQSQCAVLGVLFHSDAQLGLEDVADALAALEAAGRTAAPGDERAGGRRQAELAVEGRSAVDARLAEAELPRDDAHRDAGDVAVSMLDGVQRAEQIAVLRLEVADEVLDLERRFVVEGHWLRRQLCRVSL